MRNFGNHFGGGYYNDEGRWVQLKHCFMSCGNRCDCQPPMGQSYDPNYDKRIKENVDTNESNV